MDINITAKHSDVTQSAKNYANEKVSKLDKFKLRRADVVMDQEGDNYKIEIVAHADRSGTIVATATGEEWFSAVDLTMDKIERQLRKVKEKATSHRVKKYQPEPKDTVGQEPDTDE